jgi:prepilin-type N-terminal cleavage/methylation domain-containing protein
MPPILLKQTIKGFTLVEIIVTTGIFAVVVMLFGSYVVQSYQAIRFVEESNDAIENAKNAIQIMNKELREANGGEDGSYLISVANAQELVFYSDLDIDDATEKIRYFLDGTNLKKEVIEPTGSPLYSGSAVITTLSQYVQNGATPIFTYFKSDNTTATDIQSIRRIHTFLEVNVDPAQAPNHYIIETNVHLRNLRPNY